MNENNPFFDFEEPKQKPRSTREEHIVYVYGTHFNHVISYGKRGKKTEYYQPIGNNVPFSLRQKRYKSPWHYKQDKQRFDQNRMSKIQQWRFEHLK